MAKPPKMVVSESVSHSWKPVSLPFVSSSNLGSQKSCKDQIRISEFALFPMTEPSTKRAANESKSGTRSFLLSNES